MGAGEGAVGEGTLCLHKGPCSNPVSPCLAGAGEREKVPANPEALLLMASSQRDMEDWVQAIRRVIWSPFGGGTAHSPHVHPLEPLRPGNHASYPTAGLQDPSCSGLSGCVPCFLRQAGAVVFCCRPSRAVLQVHQAGPGRGNQGPFFKGMPSSNHIVLGLLHT